MSGPRRNLIVAGTLVLSAIAVEVALNLLRPPLARVQVVNEGETAIEDLRVAYGRKEAGIARLGPGESVHLSFDGWRRLDLMLKFRQRGNALTGFTVGDFDPAALSRDGAKLVVIVKPNAFERAQEEDEVASPRGRVFDVMGRWLEQALKSP